MANSLHHVAVVSNRYGLLVVALVGLAGSARLSNVVDHLQVEAAPTKLGCVKAMTFSLPHANYRGLFKWDPDLSQDKNIESALAEKGFVKQFEDYNFTWGTIFTKEYVTFERERLVLLGRLKDGEEPKLQSVCDLTLEGIKGMIHNPDLIAGFKAGYGPIGACKGLPEKDIVDAFTEATEDLCFSSCLSSVMQMIRGCDRTFFTTEAPFESLINQNEQCGRLPYDSLEKLADHAMSRSCFNFVAPSPLWKPDDKSFTDVSQKGDSPVCYGDGWEPRWNRSSGSCPEGTQCDCGMSNDLQKWKTTDEVRQFPQPIFVKEGIASVPNIMNQYRNGFIFGTAVASLKAGAVFGTAGGLAATLHAPVFLIGGSVMLMMKAAYKAATFSCDRMVGCWPLDVGGSGLPLMSDRKCRMSAPSRSGHSSLWFLPPPLTRVHHQNARCTLNPCTEEDVINQRVGVGRSSDTSDWYKGKPNIYNCQPLNYEAMSIQQKLLFLQQLKESGISDEYAEEIEQVSREVMHMAENSS